MTWPIPTLPTNRTNATVERDNHPGDHNAANDAINELAARVGVMGASLIQRINATAGAGSVTFSAIPQTFETLHIIASAKGVSASAAIFYRFNADATAIYDGVVGVDRNSIGGGSGAQTESSSSVTLATVGAEGGHWSSVIPGYRSAFRKSVLTSCVRMETASPFTRIFQTVMTWRGVAPITSISIHFNAAGGFAASSVFSLYGLG